MINFKEWNLKHVGEIVLLGIVLIFVVTLITTFVSPLLMTILPTIFTTALSLTDTLLLLILVRLHMTK